MAALIGAFITGLTAAIALLTLLEKVKALRPREDAHLQALRDIVQAIDDLTDMVRVKEV